VAEGVEDVRVGDAQPPLTSICREMLAVKSFGPTDIVPGREGEVISHLQLGIVDVGMVEAPGRECTHRVRFMSVRRKA
jgi:hypothetical protein